MKLNPGSLRLAFFLIAILLILIILSAIIPQKDTASGQIVDWRQILGNRFTIIEDLGLNRIYYSPFFFSVLALLAVNLLWANIKRIQQILKARDLISRIRYIGSVSFHFSLVIILGGIIANYLNKYEGVFALTEGQQVTDRADQYFREFRGPLNLQEYNRFSLKLNNLDSLSAINGQSARVARISIWQNQSEEPDTFSLCTGRPFQLNGLEFHYGLISGYSPEIVLIDSTGMRLLSSFVRLATQEVEGKPLYFDYVFIPFTELKLSIELLSNEENTPRFGIMLLAKDSSVVSYKGILALGDTVRFEKYELTIPRLRSWCYINVVKNPYLGVVFIGFWFGLAGIFLGVISRLAKWGKKSDE